MKQNLTKSFTLLIGGILILLLNAIPDHDLGGLITGASGFDFQSTFVALIGIALVLTAASKISTAEQLTTHPNAKKFVFIILAGASVSFIALFLNGTAQLIAQILSIITLLIANSLLKGAINFSFGNAATKGALMILIGGLLFIYKEIGGGIAFNIIALAGIVLFFLGLGKLIHNLDEEGTRGAKKIRLALILLIVAAFLDMIPLMGLIAGIVAIVAFIVELTGYLRMKRSTAIGDLGQSGAKILVINMVLLAVASLFGIIPFVGSMVVGGVSTLSLILWIIGWLRIEAGTVDRLTTAPVTA
ncbi:hypothetical protein [Mangrovibacterium marinum]|uniref:Uncharacterized protein n=1 Tax=Mangrovibacterium marinum TaxID=1639118 RepID=A0A2T5C2U4_9BACT|nr:hypothetical protein [Mangrovibacterium marinum]PTN09070.1 hypothetical protein C8N47_106170 [Mangrovibacterium marinum]